MQVWRVIAFVDSLSPLILDTFVVPASSFGKLAVEIVWKRGHDTAPKMLTVVRLTQSAEWVVGMSDHFAR